MVKGRGRSSHVYNEILNLKPGEILTIDKADMRKKYTPARISSYIGKRQGRKFTCEGVAGAGGWVVRRIS